MRKEHGGNACMGEDKEAGSPPAALWKPGGTACHIPGKRQMPQEAYLVRPNCQIGGKAFVTFCTRNSIFYSWPQPPPRYQRLLSPQHKPSSRAACSRTSCYIQSGLIHFTPHHLFCVSYHKQIQHNGAHASQVSKTETRIIY